MVKVSIAPRLSCTLTVAPNVTLFVGAIRFQPMSVNQSSRCARPRSKPSPQCPQDQNYCYQNNNRTNSEKNQDTVLVHQNVHTTLRVEAIESANDRGQA
jgi:hypothetical protein